MNVGPRDSGEELTFKSAAELANLIARREVSPVEIVVAIFDRLDQLNPEVNAFVTVLRDTATAQAIAAEAELVNADMGDLGPLHGLPVSVKDLTATAGVRTTYGSVHYAEHVPSNDALAWARLKAAGAILIGKTTTPEFGWRAVTESRLTGVTANPWNLARTVGGSSGGAAAAVAAGIGPLATGSDGAGSIRIPASFCGVVGFKPSLGRVPLIGEDLVYSSTEAVGPITRTVADAVLMFDVMQGPDERDPFSVGSAVRVQRQFADPSLTGVRVAFCPDLGGVPVDADVANAVAAAALTLSVDLGADVEQITIDLPDPLEHLLRFWGPGTAVFLDELVASRGVDLTLSEPSLLALAERGRAMSGIDLWRATIIERGQIHERIAEVLMHSQVLITPTAPVTAFAHPGVQGGPANVAGRAVADPTIGFLPFTAPFNMTGHPAISVPCGLDRDGMPIGLQIVGRHNADALVLRVAAAFERARPWPVLARGV